MGKYIKSINYFFKEAFTILKSNALSNLLSIISLGLIFFLFVVLLMGRLVSEDMIKELSSQAEISVYYTENITEPNFQSLLNDIKRIKGIRQVTPISSKDAYERMVSVLGEDASVLSYFDENPFSPFLELEIDLENINSIVSELGKISSIQFIRDNFDILSNLKRFTHLITVAFTFVSLAMAIITVIITSHIIRQGISNNKEQINTLRLLGAPNGFIVTPYIIEGLFITSSAALIAIFMNFKILNVIYSGFKTPLPFIVLPSQSLLTQYSLLFLIGSSLILGLLGSVFGWVSVKGKMN